MKQLFHCPVGYTPQGKDFDMDFMSIGLGANILEKRLTVDTTIPKNGHIKALDPKEFDSWITRVKQLESALGASDVIATKSDTEQSQKYFKSLHINRAVNAGDVISEDMLAAKRPGSGISAADVDEVVGRTINVSKAAETMLEWSDLAEPS